MTKLRVCDCGCGESLEGLHHKRRFFADACRKASKRKRPAAAEEDLPPCTKVTDALDRELRKLGVADTYEGQVAMGLAAQLDDGSVRGAAYASLSKELDRRVDALRLKADVPDDPAREVAAAVADKRTLLRAV